MEKEYLLPRKCQKCNSIFDLKYEVNDIESLMNESHLFCWDCKQQLFNIPINQKNEDPSNLDDFFLDLDIEFE
jgi:hypothetical protein